MGELAKMRRMFSAYPHDVWLYLLAAGWTRIGQEEAFMGRAGFVEDELGSRIVASRLVHDLMNLYFLMERPYPPYSKWFGTAFRELDCAADMLPVLISVLDAVNWQDRERQLASARSCARFTSSRRWQQVC